MRKVASRHTHKCLIVYFNSLHQAYFSTVAHMHCGHQTLLVNSIAQLMHEPSSVLASQLIIAVITGST